MELKGKRAVVVGLGITGRATALFLKKQGCDIVVSERKERENLSCAVAEIEAAGIPIEAGGHRDTTFCEAQLIVVSPGVPFHLEPIQRALKGGAQVMSEIELASRFVKVPIVAVTGTNGKSTTASLLAEIFQSSGKDTFLGGNIGLPLIEYPLSHREAEVVILELSSFQLEGIDEFRPQTSVLLNISEDHLDRYPAYQDYVEAKARIFENQRPQDHAILNREDASATHIAASIHSHCHYFSSEREMEEGAFLRGECIIYRGGDREEAFPLTATRLPGVHNRENMMAAVAAARLMACPPEKVQSALESFRGLPHRVEWVRQMEGVQFINDSKGTNVGATVKSLQSFEAPIVLIAGGRAKGGSYEPLLPWLEKRVKKLILLGEAKEEMFSALASSAPTQTVETLEEAVAAAFEGSVAGDVVLFSPACSSFDMFENFEHRGEAFRRLVADL